jgi:type IV pilus assembly protein PilA
MTNSQQKGFTPIELIGVMAISGMVAAANISTYKDYLRMSGVSEANTLFADLKTKIVNTYSDKGRWPTFGDLKGPGLVYKGVYTEMTYWGEADTPQVCFKVVGFEAGKDSIGWKYVTDPIDPKQQTWSCKASFGGCTTIEDKYLPKTCRSSPN